MGLAAGQARLLTITGRKSDCEFQSMRLSHQKIALARDLAALSNEYQNSLTQTKLIYDYYGTGDESNQLSYGLMMKPSTLNDYMPILLTDSMGRVVLDSKYAQAARAAGIPQEGLGTLPSENMRNMFIAALGEEYIDAQGNTVTGAGLMSKRMAERIMNVPYNQAAGLGGGTTVSVQTQDVTYSEFVNMLANMGGTSPLSTSFNNDFCRGLSLYCQNSEGTKTYYYSGDTNYDKWRYGYTENSGNPNISLKDILTGEYVLSSYTMDNRNYSLGHYGGAIDAITNSSFWDDMFGAIEELLDTGDPFVQKALEYARSEIEYMITYQGERYDTPAKDCGEHQWETCQYFDHDRGDYSNIPNIQNITNWKFDKKNDSTVARRAFEMASNTTGKSQYNTIGLNLVFNCDNGKDDQSCISAVSVNLSNTFKAYLTYFVDFMNGIAKTDAYGRELYDVQKNVAESRLIRDTDMLTVKIGQAVSSDVLAEATFYDAIFNQICRTGWVENDNINDNEYLQHMLQNGMMFVTSVKDDGFYYQGNYATDKYIKEVADETKIALAEAKYNTEKAKLNAKEETIDLKMKNLDTEISSLTTEYDTVKNTIAKQIEKSFKRYA